MLEVGTTHVNSCTGQLTAYLVVTDLDSTDISTASTLCEHVVFRRIHTTRSICNCALATSLSSSYTVSPSPQKGFGRGTHD